MKVKYFSLIFGNLRQFAFNKKDMSGLVSACGLGCGQELPGMDMNLSEIMFEIILLKNRWALLDIADYNNTSIA